MVELETTDLTKRIKELPIWTICSFLTFTTGYISYFTLCSINKIPYSSPNIYLIIGFGIFNLLYWYFLYSTLESGDNWAFTQSLFPLCYLSVINTSIPIILIFGGIFIIFAGDGWIRIRNFINLGDVQIGNEIEQKKLFSNWSKNKKRLADRAIFILFSIFLIYNGNNYFNGLWLATYGLRYEMVLILKEKRIIPYHIVFYLLIVPCLLSATFLNKSNFSIFGLSRAEINIVFQDGKNQNYFLYLQDPSFLFVKKTIDNDTTIAIPHSKILSYSVINEINYFKKDVKNNQSVSQPQGNNLNFIDTCR